MASLREVFASLFPTVLGGAFERAPILPADVFAFTAHVLERSGAYHHIAPEIGNNAGLRRIVVDDALRGRTVRLGAAWSTAPPPSGRRLPTPPAEVQDLWASLGAHQDALVFTHLNDEAGVPPWWIIALELMMIADEASRNIGFSSENPFFDAAWSGYVAEDLNSGAVFRRVQRAPFSLSTAMEDVVCVQAKSRTPTVGCTLRSMTHHLALLPPRGQVRARWVTPPFASSMNEHDTQLGLLLAPFPYRVADGSFKAVATDPASGWGWFDAEQTWLPARDDANRRQGFVAFVVELIAAARAKDERVHGVVLPELALDYDQFLMLGGALAREAEIDFLISGLSCNQEGRSGNFVGIAPFFLAGDRSNSLTGWELLVLVREKHHRWKIDRSQIETYGLEGLDPDLNWWENLTILSRSLDVMVYRGGTTLTTLICEDLARVDPCQAVVRAIGPNLLIALLMDGPQIDARWPGRYATVLAEDPGTSVLSFTSFGMMARQNDLAAFPQSCSIGLWKDEVNGAKRLELPREADALVLQLQSKPKEERTLDGRTDGGASHRWEYVRHTPVAARTRPDWITSGAGRP